MFREGIVMKINFKQIEAFVWVADLGSFRGAAERLNTTQPNISTRVSNLEDLIGVKLMERDAGSVRLTAKGKDLLTAARQILHAADGFVEAAGQQNLVESTVKLGVTEMIASTWLRHFLKAVKEQFPRLNIALTVDISVNLKPQLFSRSIDMAFQNGPFVRKISGSQDLGKFPYVWVGAPALDITRVGKPSRDEMRTYPILALAKDTSQFQEVDAHFGGAKGQMANIISSSSISPCIHMAIEAMGITALPATMVRRYVADGRLKHIDYHWVPAPLEFLARYDAQTAPSVVAALAVLARDIALGYPTGLDG